MLWLPFSLLNAFFESIANALSKRGAQKINTLSASWAGRFFSLFLLVPLLFISHSITETNYLFWIAVLIGSFLNTITSILFVEAIKDSPLSLTLPIVAFTPAFLLITSPLIVNEIPTFLSAVGVILIVIGSYVLNINLRNEGFMAPIKAIWRNNGSRLMLIVAIIYSITSNIDKIGVNNSNPIFYATMANLFIMFFLTLVLLYKKISFKEIFINSKILAPIGFAYGLSGTFQMIAISMTIVPNVIAVKRTSTIFGSFWGRLFFKEENFIQRIFGTILMIVGVILITLG